MHCVTRSDPENNILGRLWRKIWNFWDATSLGNQSPFDAKRRRYAYKMCSHGRRHQWCGGYDRGYDEPPTFAVCTPQGVQRNLRRRPTPAGYSWPQKLRNSHSALALWILLPVGLQFVIYHWKKPHIILTSFYRTMHFSAKRGIEIACRLSVCDVGGSGPHRLEIFQTNYTKN